MNCQRSHERVRRKWDVERLISNLLAKPHSCIQNLTAVPLSIEDIEKRQEVGSVEIDAMAYARDQISNPEANESGILTARLIRDPQRDTTEVDPLYLEIVTIHDRDFQKYSIDNSVHLVPVDEVTEHSQLSVSTSSSAWQEEAYRLETQNRMFNLVFDGRLIFPPVTGPKNVLDCGYGAASWAVELAESYPECQASLCDIIWLKYQMLTSFRSLGSTYLRN